MIAVTSGDLSRGSILVFCFTLIGLARHREVN